MQPLQDADEVTRALRLLTEPQGVFELRCLDAKLAGNRFRAGPVSGYFTSAEAAIASLGKVVAAKGVYVTLNPVQPALLARCANRLDYAERGATTNDTHIICRRWLLVDVDPDRPSGISASPDLARGTITPLTCHHHCRCLVAFGLLDTGGRRWTCYAKRLCNRLAGL